MIKKKAKSIARARKSNKAKKPGKKRAASRPFDPTKVRQELAKIVAARARKITRAVALKASNGDLAPAKYLFEMAHIHPEVLQEAKVAENEESLAETLLKSLNVPTDPVIHDLYERGEDVIILPPNAGRTPDGEEKKDEELAVTGASV